MCGICGIVGQPDEQLIKSMLARIAHRGPDDEGVCIAKTSSEQRVGLGHRRLSINSLKVFQLLTLELWHRAFIDDVA